MVTELLSGIALKWVTTRPEWAGRSGVHRLERFPISGSAFVDNRGRRGRDWPSPRKGCDFDKEPFVFNRRCRTVKINKIDKSVHVFATYQACLGTLPGRRLTDCRRTADKTSHFDQVIPMKSTRTANRSDLAVTDRSSRPMRAQTLSGWHSGGRIWLLWVMVGWGLAGTGCGSDPQMERLAGTWGLDLAVNSQLVDELMDGQAPDQQSLKERLVRGAAKQFLQDKLPGAAEALQGAVGNSMQLTFTADGAWSSRTAMPMAWGQKSGRWRVRESGADFLEITCTWTDSGSQQMQSVETRVQFLEPGRIRMVPPNMGGTELPLTFQRQPEK